MNQNPFVAPAGAGASQPIVTFDGVGFENFDWDMLSIMAQRLGVAALLAALIAYRPWRRLIKQHFDPVESGAQVLIAVAGGMIVTIIGDSIAIAFALVGLGGFIRFRSGIKDPREAGVMFLMIGIGMSCGIGRMPIALVATTFGIILLWVLDAAETRRRQVVRRRLRFGGIEDPRRLEPKIRAAIQQVATIRGSKIRLRADEIVIDIFGDTIESAGEALELLGNAGLTFDGDVSCEEI